MLPVRHNQNWMPDIFNDFFDNTWMERPKATAPAINVLETPDAYQLELAAPGMTKADFDIHLDEEGDLVIKMEKKGCENEQQKGHYVRREFSYTNYEQTYILPDEVDKEHISAKVEDGILSIEMPKLAPEPEKKVDRVIEIG